MPTGTGIEPEAGEPATAREARADGEEGGVLFTTDMLVRFHHCDPAGIVFYPRYFEMVNMVVEDWFAEAIGWSFGAMSTEAGTGVPTVHVECDFVRASQIGELLTFELGVEKIGTTSFALRVAARCGAQERLRVRAVLVYVQVGNDYRKLPLPARVREPMHRYLAAAE